VRACGHNCFVSSGICEEMTFGRGKLSDSGYWEIPCELCAAAFAKRNPDLASKYGVWPMPNIRGRSSCSKESHERFKRSKEWQDAEPAAGGSLIIHEWGEVHQMRNCPKCKSTLSRTVEKGIPESEWDGKGVSVILKDGRVTVGRGVS
jgi:hypothetical protein